MTLTYEKKHPRKFVMVVHVSGRAEKDDDVIPLLSIHNHPQHAHVINLNNKDLVIESSPTLEGPWVETDKVRKNNSDDIVIHNLYTRVKSKINDTFNFWVTIFKT